MPVNIFMYNGFDYPEQVHEVDDWGFDGPTLGPFDMIQVTYGEDVKLYDFNEGESYCMSLHIHEGYLVYKDKFYGDFTIMSS